MKNKSLALIGLLVATLIAWAKPTDLFAAEELDSVQVQEMMYRHLADSVNESMQYQHGDINLMNGVATLKVPGGYKFLDAEQSNYVLTDLWGNPPSEVLGLLFPEDMGPLSENFTYAVELSYSTEGYIDDDDAGEIDYTELLEGMQADADEVNPERTRLGYPTVELVGWASPPYYDHDNKKLHWAKELKFEGGETNTLNYNIRVLGRKGYLTLNAIGNMEVLPTFKRDIDPILASVEFGEGYRYAEFDPELDKVAAVGIGGLIAGKVLMKAGIIAGIVKFWKLIALGVVGAFAAFRKRLAGRKDKQRFD